MIDIEDLVGVSNLRYRGGRVYWRRAGDDDVRLCRNTVAPLYRWIGRVSLESLGYVGTASVSEDSALVSYTSPYCGTAGDAAIYVVRELLQRDTVVPADEIRGFADGGHAFVLSPELLALASAVAQRRGQSLDDLLTRIVTTKVVSIAVVDYRDDPEIRRLHIALAESWGKE